MEASKSQGLKLTREDDDDYQGELAGAECLEQSIVPHVTWAAMKELYSSSTSVAKRLLIGGAADGIEVVNALLMVRAYSRVLVDMCINDVRRSGKRVWSIAAGSTDITSDYDVSLVGPGAIKAVRCVVQTAQRRLGGKQLSVVADTNLYVSPSFAYLAESKPFPGVELSVYAAPELGDAVRTGPAASSKDPGKWHLRVFVARELERGAWLAYPVPESPVAFQAERVALLQRFFGYGTPPNLETMLSFGKKLVRFQYPSSRSHLLTEEEYWTSVINSMVYSVEAYVAVSTVLAVVVEMQQKTVGANLKKQIYEHAAVENYCDLRDHGGLSRDASHVVIVQTSKYVKRILYCLDRAWSRDGTDTEKQVLQQLLQHSGLVDGLVAKRGSASVTISAEEAREIELLYPRLVQLGPVFRELLRPPSRPRAQVTASNSLIQQRPALRRQRTMTEPFFSNCPVGE
jgi:hypothetical protein